MNEHIISWIIIILSHIPSSFVTPLDSSKKKMVQWFSTHALVNMVISYWTYNAVYLTIVDPYNSYNVKAHKETIENSNVPICLALWLHVYHVLFYKLTREDVFHHFLFATFLAIPGYYYEWGILRNCNLFFICGLPGGLIYALLALQKCGYLLSIPEQYFSLLMNGFIRCPGCLFSSFLLFKCFIENSYEANCIAFIIQLVLTPYNAVYYTIQSIKRATRYAYGII